MYVKSTNNTTATVFKRIGLSDEPLQTNIRISCDDRRHSVHTNTLGIAHMCVTIDETTTARGFPAKTDNLC